MATHSTTTAALTHYGIQQAEVALALGLDPSTISHKLAGRRRWSQPEVTALLALVRRKDAAVTYEDLFGEVVVEETEPAPLAAAGGSR